MKKCNTYRRYSDKEKLEFLERFKNSGLNMNQFQRKYNLGNTTISRWMTKFGLSFENKEVLMGTINQKSFMERTNREENLEARIKQLEQELKDEKIKSLAYKTMIEIAEEELGIDISKKAGAKR